LYRSSDMTSRAGGEPIVALEPAGTVNPSGATRNPAVWTHRDHNMWYPAETDHAYNVAVPPLAFFWTRTAWEVRREANVVRLLEFFTCEYSGPHVQCIVG
jgi:hypothetical protein